MPEAKRILITEDDDEVRRLFRMSLQMHGFDVDEAGSGHDALQLLDAALPDLIVLDLGLPGIDGLSVQRELAAHAIMRQIPIVIVTASDADLSHVDVACVLRKPILSEDLLKTVRQCLEMGARNIDLS